MPTKPMTKKEKEALRDILLKAGVYAATVIATGVSTNNTCRASEVDAIQKAADNLVESVANLKNVM